MRHPKTFDVTLKRMLDGKPDIHRVNVQATSTPQAAIMASRELRRQGMTDCVWTMTRVIRS